MTTNSQRSLTGAGCDVAFDNLTRQLYATGASIYQMEPMAVAFPRSADDPSVPVIFLEPSYYSMFVEDYRELNLADSPTGARRAVLFEKFVEDILARELHALRFQEGEFSVATHAHYHAKALMKPGFMSTLAARIPGAKVTMLKSGCCGMAGAFGALDSKYGLSVQVAQQLVRQIGAQPVGATIVASGTSCRHQIEHLTPVKPKHMAELLADALA